MKLYLIQHGDALSKEVDPERPLSDQGKADVEQLAEFLSQAGVKAERVLHSGKLRAQQTAEALAAAISSGLELEVSGLMNPSDNPKAFDWQSASWDRDTLIVGHLPFMSRLASHLLTEDEERLSVAFQPGSILCLEHNGTHWQINWMIRPELIR